MNDRPTAKELANIIHGPKPDSVSDSAWRGKIQHTARHIRADRVDSERRGLEAQRKAQREAQERRPVSERAAASGQSTPREVAVVAIWDRDVGLDDLTGNQANRLTDIVERIVVAERVEQQRLHDLIWNPHTDDFLEAVRLEAAHQRERWGNDHDEGKAPPDWFWLLGYLSGKALAAAIKCDREKALHHTISSAAVLLNWHAHISGVRSDFQPGIDAPEEGGPS